jgi:hypothetical protein
MIEREAWDRYKMHARSARGYILRARKRWMTVHSVDRDALRAELEGGIREVWERAMESGDYRAVMLAARALADLHGAMAPAKFHVEHSGTVAALTDEQEAARLEELRREQDAKKPAE